jgi:hypothetical protein
MRTFVARKFRSQHLREKSYFDRGRMYRSLSTVLVVLVCLIVTNANATGFTTTYNLGSINVADYSIPPVFFTGPFNYGYSPLALDTTVNGLVNITSISVSADATVNFPLVLQNGNFVAFDWEVYVGPSPFGYLPGQVLGSLTRPDTLTGTTPTLLRFSQSDLYQTTALPQFTGTYDFLSSTLTSNAPYFSSLQVRFRTMQTACTRRFSCGRKLPTTSTLATSRSQLAERLCRNLPA